MRNLNTILNLIKYPVLTEKSILLFRQKTYIFIINKILTKQEIKFFFKIFFNINIIKINTLNLSIKKQVKEKKIERKSKYKKIYFKLKINEFNLINKKYYLNF